MKRLKRGQLPEFNENLHLISLYAIGFILFFMSWTIAYYFLPEGLERNIGQLGRLAGDTAASSLHREFIQILLLNMLGFTFSIPMEATMAPSLDVFGRSGLYEMMAAVLFAVATNTISFNKSETFFTPSKKVPRAERSMKKEQWIAMSIALLILAAAAFREAYMYSANLCYW